MNAHQSIARLQSHCSCVPEMVTNSSTQGGDRVTFIHLCQQGWATSVLEDHSPTEFISVPNQTHLLKIR